MRRRKLRKRWPYIFIAVSSVCAVADMSRGILAPFLPAVADTRNISSLTVGAIFATPAVAVVLATPAAPSLVHSVGERVALVTSGFIFATSMLAFAWVDRLPIDGHWFTASAIGLRAVQGLACTAMDTAAGSLVMRAAPPGRESDSMGWLEAARGLGSLLGPPVGGLLYDLSGWEPPFLTSGGVALLLLIPLALFVPAPAPSCEQSKPPISMASLFCTVPEAMAMATLITTSLVAVSFLQPTLAVYTAHTPFFLSAGAVGLLFGLLTLSYICVSIVSGALASRIGDAHQVILGVLTFAVGYLLLGGAPFMTGADAMRPTVGIIAVGMSCIGVAGGLSFAPGNALAISGARDAGFTIEQVAAALTAGLNMAFALGNIAGPLMGGTMVALFGFRWSCTMLGSLLVVACLGIAPCLYYRRWKTPAVAAAAAAVTDSRSAALLDSA